MPSSPAVAEFPASLKKITTSKRGRRDGRREEGREETTVQSTGDFWDGDESFPKKQGRAKSVENSRRSQEKGQGNCGESASVQIPAQFADARLTVTGTEASSTAQDLEGGCKEGRALERFKPSHPRRPRTSTDQD